MRILVTGPDGFVGSRLVRRAVNEGHQVVAAIRPGQTTARSIPVGPDVSVVPLELTDQASVDAAVSTSPDVVVHLAAVASGADARRDPLLAWQVNALGTVRLLEALGHARARGASDPVLLVVSTGEVYGMGEPTPRVESDPPRPCSPYAATKLAAETAALEMHRRTGLKVLVARAFAHTGAGQDERFFVPAVARRLKVARRVGAPAIKVGNLAPVREFMHVDDVVDAYLRLLSGGRPGEVYNVASGQAVRLAEVFDLLAGIVGHRPVPEVDPLLVRTADIPYLVGDSTKLRAATGWEPRVELERTLREVVDAQAD